MNVQLICNLKTLFCAGWMIDDCEMREKSIENCQLKAEASPFVNNFISFSFHHFLGIDKGEHYQTRLTFNNENWFFFQDSVTVSVDGMCAIENVPTLMILMSLCFHHNSRCILSRV